MGIICLLRLFFGNPGFVPDYFKSEEIGVNEQGEQRLAIYRKEDYEKKMFSESDLENADVQTPLATVTIKPDVARSIFTPMTVGSFYKFKYCHTCKEVKPPRTHHCGVCESCVLKMDHHCPWVGRCVGLLNHKFFWLFLFHTLVALILQFSFLLTSPEGKKFYNMTMISSAAVAGSVIVMLIIHTLLIMRNWTTIEAGALWEDNIFRNKSCLYNWRLVFGQNCLLWFLPVG